jgi:hypothetical protein
VSSTLILVSLIGCVAILSVVNASDWSLRSRVIMLLIFSAGVGWLSAVMFSPYNKIESRKFGSAAKAIGAFASGYVLGKVDKLATYIFSPEFMFDTSNSLNILSCGAIAILTFLITYIHRTYAPNTRLANNAADRP